MRGLRGLAAANASPVRWSFIDRTNHHVFQPLLYQVLWSDPLPHSRDAAQSEVEGLFPIVSDE
jgi:hypothetical protein